VATWRVTIEYDGRRFSGWQRQAGARTVQECVEDALSRFFGTQRIVVHASGRTDAGVHALGQVISFRTDIPRDPAKCVLALNTFLPEDAAARDAAIVDDRFHARSSATGKLYRTCCGTGRSARRSGSAGLVPPPARGLGGRGRDASAPGRHPRVQGLPPPRRVR